MSSNAATVLTGLHHVLPLALLCAAPLAAQDAATPPPADAPARPRIDVLVTVPRGEINQAQVQECEDRADAGTISGEIVVCRQVGDDGSNALSSSRGEAQKRYAQETAFKGAPPPPDMFGIPDNGAGIGLGSVPPPALYIDVAGLPKAPAGSDADRIARGLPPLGQDAELTEEQERARREAAGIKTIVPPRGKRKN